MPDRPELADRNLGTVSYEFRLTQTEIITTQWLEFVLAYAPYTGTGLNTSFHGLNIEHIAGA